MKKVDFFKKIIGLDGNPIKTREDGADAYLSEVLGNAMVMMKAEQDACRQHLIATTIFLSNGPIELEDADFNLVKNAIKKANFSCLIETQLTQSIKEAEKVD